MGVGVEGGCLSFYSTSFYSKKLKKSEMEIKRSVIKRLNITSLGT